MAIDAGSRVVCAVGMSRRMVEFRGGEPSNVGCALRGNAVHPASRNGSAHVPGRDMIWLSTQYAISQRSNGHSDGSIKKFSRFQHGMHCDGQLASQGGSGALEAEALPQFQTPCSQAAFGITPRQDDD